jgi:hypothetical protein
MASLQVVANKALAVEDGVEVVSDPIQQRRLVFTRNFSKGSVIFSERPLIVFESGQRWAASLLSAFLSADEPARRAVMDCFTPPLDSPEADIQKRRAVAAALAKLPDLGMPIDELHRLLLVSDFNSHAFRAAAEVGETTEGGATPYSALFELSSKAEHSCWPNVFQETSSGILIATAARDVRRGEFVTASYLGPALDVTRDERRAALLRDKLFECTCERCAGPDFCRPRFVISSEKVPTPFCRRGCTMIRTLSSDVGGQILWRCAMCHATRGDDDSFVRQAGKVELTLMTALSRVAEKFWSDRPSGGEYEELLALLSRAKERRLPKSHQFFSRCYDLGSSLAASEARRAASIPDVDARRLQIRKFRLIAAAASLELLTWKNALQDSLDKYCGLLSSEQEEEVEEAEDEASTAAGAFQNDKLSKSKLKKSKQKLPQRRTEKESLVSEPFLAALALDDLKRRVNELFPSLADVRSSGATKPCYASTKEAWFAASDFMKAGRSDLAAPIFRAYAPLLAAWLRPDDADRRLVAAVLAKSYPHDDISFF